MDEALPLSLVITVATILIIVRVSGFKGVEKTVIACSFAAHVAGTFAQVWITRAAYEYSDMPLYIVKGDVLAAVVRSDPGHFLLELVKLLFHQVPVLPVTFAGFGSSTGSMTALAGIFCYATEGGIYTLSCIAAVFACFGKVALYEAFRAEIPEPARGGVAIAVLLVPSTVFWSSGFLKESFAIAGLGYLAYGMQQVVTRRRVLGLLYVIFGGIVVALFKAYILFAYALAAGAWTFLVLGHRSRLALKPVHFVIGGIIAVGGVTALGRLFPGYALESLAEQAAYHQGVGQVAAGGSTYSLGNPDERTLIGQLAYAPWALITALFRPFLYEVRNAQMLANALETLVILGMSAHVLWRSKPTRIGQLMLGSPLLVFCAVFSLTFGVAVGLTTTNLGTLSRYRMPLVPMFCTLLVLLKHETRSLPAQVANLSKLATRWNPRASI